MLHRLLCQVLVASVVDADREAKRISARRRPRSGIIKATTWPRLASHSWLSSLAALAAHFRLVSGFHLYQERLGRAFTGCRRETESSWSEKQTCRHFCHHWSPSRPDFLCTGVPSAPASLQHPVSFVQFLCVEKKCVFCVRT